MASHHSPTAPLESYRSGPDERGHFGMFGGRFVAETLMPLILDLEQAYDEAKTIPRLSKDFDYYATHYIGRPSPLCFAKSLTSRLSAVQKSISSATS